MFLFKFLSWVISPWKKNKSKSKESKSEEGDSTAAAAAKSEVNINETKKAKKGWKLLKIILLIVLIALIADVIALNVKVNNLIKQSNPSPSKANTTVENELAKSVTCMVLLGSQSDILKNFPCEACLESGSSFYNVTEFCILRSFWRNALNQTAFEKLRWLGDNNYCNWGGVKCNENKNVVGLEFLAPFVPFAFTANLVQMTTLRKITITGDGTFPEDALPDVLFQLNTLEELNIISTGYTGPIPSKVKPSGNVNLNLLVSLKKLVLANNTQLNGTIPDEFAPLKELKELNLTNNQLTGPIPNSIGTIDINRLDLSGNLLTGTVPDNICQRNYADAGCNLGRNQLTLPQSCGKCTFT